MVTYMSDLIQKWQSGDMGAFETLFCQYEKLVFRTAYLITGSKEEADDTLQEVFLSVWKSRHTFNPTRAKFSTWLHRITINRCASKHRKKQLACLSLEGGSLDRPDMNCQELPEEMLANKWECDRLIEVLNSMDIRHRTVIVLRYFNQLSYDEIAQVAHIPLGTVKSRINQALKYMRQQLSVREGKPEL